MDEDVLKSKDTINTFMINLIDSRIKSILKTISLNYPEKFSKILIDKEVEYIKKHIVLEYLNIINIKDDKLDVKHIIKKKIIKIKHIQIKNIVVKPFEKLIEKPVVKKRIINIEEQCSGRVWTDSIFSKKNKEKINNIETKYKVIDYKDIDLEDFTKKYIIGSRCSKSKIKENKYCKLHANHLIHGDYFEIPSKELCYHFIKDGKYL